MTPQALRTVFDRMGHRVGAEAGVRGIRALLGDTVHPADVRSIACPTAVVGGAEDERFTPAMHEEFAAAIPGATVTLVPRAGQFHAHRGA